MIIVRGGGRPTDLQLQYSKSWRDALEESIRAASNLHGAPGAIGEEGTLGSISKHELLQAEGAIWVKV